MPYLFHDTFKAMGSPCQVQFFAESEGQAAEVYQAILERVTTLESRYSRYRESSLITEINRRAGSGTRTGIDPETFGLLNYAEQCYQESDGLFDVTSGVLRKLWHFDSDTVPSPSEIRQLLPLIGWNMVEWTEEWIYLPKTGMELDFGGIVKEYAADTAAGLCLNRGVNSAIIELGGDIKVVGPIPDGSGWPVAIRDPRHPGTKIAEFHLKSGALASSGDYERFQMIDGVRYSHLLNPKTGWPVKGLRATSVVADHCVVAGSLATVSMLKAGKGLKWLQRLNMPFLCCRSNGQIINRLDGVGN